MFKVVLTVKTIARTTEPAFDISIGYCRARRLSNPKFVYLFIGLYIPNLPPPPVGPPTNTCFFGLTRVSAPMSILIGSAVFTVLTVVTTFVRL